MHLTVLLGGPVSTQASLLVDKPLGLPVPLNGLHHVFLFDPLHGSLLTRGLSVFSKTLMSLPSHLDLYCIQLAFW